MDVAPITDHDEIRGALELVERGFQDMIVGEEVTVHFPEDRCRLHALVRGLSHAAQLPCLFSLYHQNKERTMLERLEHHSAGPDAPDGPFRRPMRVSLFTDTLGDVNGVSRFIQNVAARANETGRDLQVITSTGFETPDWPNIFNFKPVFATKMPKYEQLELVLPPVMKILRHVDRHQPDVLHISTPGPVGMIGYLAARMLRVPVLGVYHTDFPAYIDHLFDDHAYTSICSAYMRFFYTPFKRIFTRSADYVDSLVRLGMPRDRVLRLMPGIETARFNTSFRDEGVWSRLAAERADVRGVEKPAVRVLYVGRVSVEKNLPLLVTVWKRVQERLVREAHRAQLIVVGDGPYRGRMEEELRGRGAYCLGFRHGDELSTIYATSDLFAFPSVTDTLGQVVMESQASGMPVVVTDRGGPKEVVREGETGFVLGAEDIEGWSRRIADLVLDDGKRRRMGEAAAESMKSFDIRDSFEHFWRVHLEAWREHQGAVIGSPESKAAASADLVGA